MERPVLHVINRLAAGAGAEKQVSELVARSALPSRILELHPGGERPASRVAWLRREIRAGSPAALVAWLDRSQIAVALAGGGSWPRIACVRAPGQRRGAARGLILRGAYRRFDAFVANSAALRDATRQWSGAARRRPFAVIPNGVDVAGPAASSPGPRGGPLRLGFVGRVNDWKGFDVLLDALAALPEGTATLRAVGPGVPEAVAAHPVAPRAEAVGRCEDPWAELGAVDLLVFPSRRGSEGSPNVVLEAFARGIPVLGSDDPPVAELLADGRGRIVSAGEPALLAAAIGEVAANPATAPGWAERAEAYVGAAHDWQRVVASWDRLISDLVNARAIAGPEA